MGFTKAIIPLCALFKATPEYFLKTRPMTTPFAMFTVNLTFFALKEDIILMMCFAFVFLEKSQSHTVAVLQDSHLITVLNK